MYTSILHNIVYKFNRRQSKQQHMHTNILFISLFQCQTHTYEEYIAIETAQTNKKKFSFLSFFFVWKCLLSRKWIFDWMRSSNTNKKFNFILHTQRKKKQVAKTFLFTCIVNGIWEWNIENSHLLKHVARVKMLVWINIYRRYGKYYRNMWFLDGSNALLFSLSHGIFLWAIKQNFNLSKWIFDIHQKSFYKIWNKKKM